MTTIFMLAINCVNKPKYFPLLHPLPMTPNLILQWEMMLQRQTMLQRELQITNSLVTTYLPPFASRQLSTRHHAGSKAGLWQ